MDKIVIEGGKKKAWRFQLKGRENKKKNKEKKIKTRFSS